MKTKEFIEKAIEGGWRTNHRYALTFLKVGKKNAYFTITHTLTGKVAVPVPEILLDPLAWQAVGKVEGWKKWVWSLYLDAGELNLKLETDDDSEHPGWDYGFRWETHRFYMHRMIDTLCEGKSIEQFLETL